jgi:sodium/proline symporter
MIQGRTFGPWVTAGTMFASVFSGYTVVGIPNESFTKGFYAFRWVPAFATVNALLIGTGVRLRKVSIVRNHQTSVDFLTDRYRSQVLRFSIFTIQIVASIVYLAAQVNSLRSTFNAMFGIPFENIGPVLGIMAIILLMEWCGGLAVIAMSDAFQGVIMVISFLMISSIIKKDFGGCKSSSELHVFFIALLHSSAHDTLLSRVGA